MTDTGWLSNYLIPAAFASAVYTYNWFTSCTDDTNCDEKIDKHSVSPQWLAAFPKIELHAHLHGSIPPEVVSRLYAQLSRSHLFCDVMTAEEKQSDPNKSVMDILRNHKTFEDCFAMFDIIHKIVQSKRVLEEILDAVLISFAKQNVRYLELRTTPRALKHSGHSRKEYVQIVCNAIKTFPFRYADLDRFGKKKMVVRFIVAVDNAKPLEEAWETVEIAKELRAADPLCPIVGIDFAPKPKEERHLNMFGAVLEAAREAGMKVTIHYAEYPHRGHQDMTLQFRPDRLGHGVLLQAEDWKVLVADPIPIEMCPTSNLFTRSIPSYGQHPFGRLWRLGRQFKWPGKGKSARLRRYPMLFCTDDCGVFQSDLVSEWTHMTGAFGLTRDDVRELTLNAVDFTFLDETEKIMLKTQLEEEFAELM